MRMGTSSRALALALAMVHHSRPRRIVHALMAHARRKVPVVGKKSAGVQTTTGIARP